MKFLRIFFIFSLPVLLFSCKITERLPNYLERGKLDTTGHGTSKIPEWQIQKNDLLSIQIHSTSTKKEIDELYNLPEGNTTASAGQVNTSGFLVDLQGNFEHPRLGTFHAEGLTKQELAAEIKKRLTEPVELLKDPTVIIRLMNFRVTVLGEVRSSGTITVPGERMTILEAIGLSGDITQYGLKHNVKVFREINGKREIGMIDLSSQEMFDSPYYNLAQNDIIVVEPSKQKAKQLDQAIVSQRISLALTVISAAALFYNFFK